MWSSVKLPVVTSSERATYKRCKKRWYWAWRRGLVLKTKQFDALDLGTWVHAAFERWYARGRKRNGNLVDHFLNAANAAINEAIASGAPDYIIEQAEPLIALGEEMIKAYKRKYGQDENVRVLRVEIPLEFTIPHPRTGLILAVHKLKPDMVFMDEHGWIWLMEHKTAKTIKTAHLVLDDQARPYGAMAEPALRKMGIIRDGRRFAGIKYNFLRKALPDLRPTNSQGQFLNKNGSVSAKQPPPYFVRHPQRMSTKERRNTLIRVRDETLEITETTLLLRTKQLHPDRLSKTPHKSCDKLCPFFTMCVAEEGGTDIRQMQRDMYIRRDPYLYQESADEIQTFEVMG